MLSTIHIPYELVNIDVEVIHIPFSKFINATPVNSFKLQLTSYSILILYIRLLGFIRHRCCITASIFGDALKGRSFV